MELRGFALGSWGSAAPLRAQRLMSDIYNQGYNG